MWRGMGINCPIAPNKVCQTMYAKIQELSKISKERQLDLSRGQSPFRLGFNSWSNQVDGMFKVDQG